MKYLASLVSLCALLSGADAHGGPRRAGVPRASVNETVEVEIDKGSSSSSSSGSSSSGNIADIGIGVEVNIGQPDSYYDCKRCPKETIMYGFRHITIGSNRKVSDLFPRKR